MMLQQQPCRTGVCARAFAPARPLRAQRASTLRVRAEAESNEAFEERIASLKRAKGQTPMGEGKKSASKAVKSASPSKKSIDFSTETLYLETPPAYGDLAVNVALGATLLWLPLTFAAIGRTAFVRYRFTDMRLSVVSDAPWKKEQLDAAYSEITDVRAIGRGVGAWGDMVFDLRSGDKVEMRAVPRWQELRDYVLARSKELRAAEDGGGSGSGSSGGKSFLGPGGKGFA